MWLCKIFVKMKIVCQSARCIYTTTSILFFVYDLCSICRDMSIKMNVLLNEDEGFCSLIFVEHKVRQWNKHVKIIDCNNPKSTCSHQSFNHAIFCVVV